MKTIWTKCYLCSTPSSVPGTGGVCLCCQHQIGKDPHRTWAETINTRLVKAGAPRSTCDQW